MHNAGFKALKLNYVYLPFSVPQTQLKAAVQGLIPLNFKGVNITVPHKQKALTLMDKLSKEAKLVGAINTVEIKDNKLIGHNTDAPGFIESLKKDAGFNLKNKVLFLMGAGGAGRAVAFASALQGIKKIFIKELNNSLAVKLKNNLRAHFPKLIIETKLRYDEQIEAGIKEADILVNATPLGMKPKDPCVIRKDFLKSDLLVYDLVYNPLETKLLKRAKQKKCQAVSGLGMLLYQGIKAFEIWTKKRAPLKVMKRALKEAIYKH
jgi:shikimate dehydrogenase